MNPQSEERFQLKLFIVTFILGVGSIALAVRLGKIWEIADVVYDLGVAVLTVALVELLIFRVLRELAARRTALEKLSQELRDLDERHKKQMETFDHAMKDIKLDNVFTTLHKMDEILTLKLEEIHRVVDPRYAAAVQRATTQQPTTSPKP